ncbi:uncharacterized protein METZ01_LOCUS511940, partial [marine metagenome]
MTIDFNPNTKLHWRRIRRSLSVWIFIGPAAFLVTLFFFIPVVILIWISLTNLSSQNFGNPEFIGLANYVRLFKDR